MCKSCKDNKCKKPSCCEDPCCEIKVPCPPKCCITYQEEEFASLLTPMSNLQPSVDPGTGSVEFTEVIVGRNVTLQWEGFSGLMAANGVAYLTINQTIRWPPSGTFTSPVIIIYKSVPRIGYFYISSNDTIIQGRIYLSTDGTSSGINVGDSVQMNSGSVSWIIA